MRTAVENATGGKTKSPTKSEKNVVCRKSLRNLQPTASDKENLVGGGMTPASIRENLKTSTVPFEKRNFLNESHCSKSDELQKKKLSNKCIQTDEEKLVISSEDLTTKGTPSVKYWKSLANTKQVSLEKVLVENGKLKEKILLLEEEVKNYKIMLSESEDIVGALKELLDSPADLEDADVKAHEDQNLAEHD